MQKPGLRIEVGDRDCFSAVPGELKILHTRSANKTFDIVAPLF